MQLEDAQNHGQGLGYAWVQNKINFGGLQTPGP